MHYAADDSNFCFRMANGTRARRLSCDRPRSVHVISSRPPPGLITSLLGGTNLRVCLVNLQGQGKFEVTQSKYRLTEEQKQDDGQKLFDFCAESLKTFIDSNSGEDGILRIAEGQKLPLGFTVTRSLHPEEHLSDLSYLDSSVILASKWCSKHLPSRSDRGLVLCRQNSIDHGVLIRWTKGFGAPNTEGQNVAEMFQRSLDKYVRRRHRLEGRLGVVTIFDKSIL